MVIIYSMMDLLVGGDHERGGDALTAAPASGRGLQGLPPHKLSTLGSETVDHRAIGYYPESLAVLFVVNAPVFFVASGACFVPFLGAE